MSSLSVLAPVLRRTRRLGQVVAMTAAGSVLAAGAAQAAEAPHASWHRWGHRAAYRAAPSHFPASCPQRSVLVACVDQDHQKMWIQEGSKVVFPAVTVRTGKPGLRTPDGLYKIYWRHQHQYSYLFDEPMPYSLFFFRGYALHATYDDVRFGGSHGCVNLRLDDARKVFGMMGVGDLVYIWGHKHAA